MARFSVFQKKKPGQLRANRAAHIRNCGIGVDQATRRSPVSAGQPMIRTATRLHHAPSSTRALLLHPLGVVVKTLPVTLGTICSDCLARGVIEAFPAIQASSKPRSPAITSYAPSGAESCGSERLQAKERAPDAGRFSACPSTSCRAARFAITLRFIGASPRGLTRTTYCCLSRLASDLPNNRHGQFRKRMLDHPPFLHPFQRNFKARIITIEIEQLIAVRGQQFPRAQHGD